MVWKSWGGLLSIALLLASSSAPLCSGAGDVAVNFSSAPRRVSKSTSAEFAFLVLQSNGVPCVDCAITCKLDGERASDCGGPATSGNGNGTRTVSYAGLKDGNHTLAVCASRRRGGGGGGGGGGAGPTPAPTCATYAWDVG
uniref:Uncharacterized protein n=1 Tax=Arundo donax TaxID=35708 RepID=A0A0A9D6P3_ARUDO